MRTRIRQQSPDERIRNFSEVSLGFSDEGARVEAERCLQCKSAPCTAHCPVHIDIPAFIRLIREGRRAEALEKIKERNNLPGVCGRVCPQEDQCECACVLQSKHAPINIGALERYASDCPGARHAAASLHRGISADRAYKIAVVGSGPAGLTCAADLAKMGYAVTLFESLHIAGGVLVYGIPEFRLPKTVVSDEVAYIRSLGVELRTDFLVGATCSVQELLTQGYRAVFIATGAGLPQFLGVPGENLGRVYSANEFLTRINLMKAYQFPSYATPLAVGKKVAVVGGGNVAFDAARSARRFGRDAVVVYRRTRAEMPARYEEVENAEAEGVVFELLAQPVALRSDAAGFVNGLECIRMRLAEPDHSGRRRPVPVENSRFTLDADTVVIAVGQKPNPLLLRTTAGLKVSAQGTIVVNEQLMTALPGVFAGGDIITGADTVIAAMGAGKRAAEEIDKYIKTVS